MMGKEIPVIEVDMALSPGSEGQGSFTDQQGLCLVNRFDVLAF